MSAQVLQILLEAFYVYQTYRGEPTTRSVPDAKLQEAVQIRTNLMVHLESIGNYRRLVRRGAS
jgi:hypothetical protein